MIRKRARIALMWALMLIALGPIAHGTIEASLQRGAADVNAFTASDDLNDIGHSGIRRQTPNIDVWRRRRATRSRVYAYRSVTSRASRGLRPDTIKVADLTTHSARPCLTS